MNASSGDVVSPFETAARSRKALRLITAAELAKYGDYAYVRNPPRRLETKAAAEEVAARMGPNWRPGYDEQRHCWAVRWLSPTQLRAEAATQLRKRAEAARELGKRWQDSHVASCRAYAVVSFQKSRELEIEAEFLEAT